MSDKVSATKIFISHRSLDNGIGTALKDYLIKIGIKEELIYYTSAPEHGVECEMKEIRQNLIEARCVIFVVSKAFYNSAYCLNEMGAVWYSGDKEVFVFGLNDIIDKKELIGFIDKNYKLHRFSDEDIDTLCSYLKRTFAVEDKEIKFLNAHKKSLLESINNLNKEPLLNKDELKVSHQTKPEQKMLELWNSGRLDDRDKLFLLYILEERIVELRAGWRDKEEIEAITIWESNKFINHIVSSNYNKCLRLLIEYDLATPSGFTSHGNVREYEVEKAVKDFANRNEIRAELDEVASKNAPF